MREKGWGGTSILTLLDVSVAIANLDHSILLDWLKYGRYSSRLVFLLPVGQNSRVGERSSSCSFSVESHVI